MDTKGRPATGPLTAARPASTPDSGGRPVPGADPRDAVHRAPGGLPAHSASSENADIPVRAHSASGRDIDQAARDALWDVLNTEPWSMDFFAAVRRIEALYPDAPGFGWSNRASEDPIRFAQQPSLAFPPCTLKEYDPPRGNAAARLYVNFMGLTGPNGPLPLHLTEYAFEREKHHKDRTFARFLDIFHHRAISLFYRAWAASQMPASFDRRFPVGDGESLTEVQRQQVLLNDTDRYAVYIGSLFGLGMPGVRFRDAVPDSAKLFMAGRFTGFHRGPEGLRAVLRDYLGVEVHIEEFAGRWLNMPTQDFCRVGVSSPVAGSLGSMGGHGGAVMGSRVWDAQGMFRIVLGPMSYENYEKLLPGRPTARRLEAWIRNYVGDEFAWEALLEIRAREVPRTKLGEGARLGWTTWCYSGASPEDRADLSLRSKR